MHKQDITKKRQKKRKEAEIYKVSNTSDKPKFYVLDMFPYPSGAGLHVGHPKGYIATDVLSRKKILEGYNVLHPMGFDTFGLGTENYAIKNKITPQQASADNIAIFKAQLEKFGFTYDLEREINTADPKYYKRTQRIFLKFYTHYYDEAEQKAKSIEELEAKIRKNPKLLSHSCEGRNLDPRICEDDSIILDSSAMPQNDSENFETKIKKYLDTQRLAYIDYKPINRCPNCKTGLANEDLDDGKCERCAGEVEQKPMRQRVLRITKYAERLIQGLDGLDWEESMKELERNWIGKSEGTEFTMFVKIPENGAENTGEGSEEYQRTEQRMSENIGEGKRKFDDGSYEIIGCAMEVHKQLGPGLQEKIYHKALQKVLEKKGFKVESEKGVSYKVDGEEVGYGSIDLVVNGKIALELKSRKQLQGDFYKQLRAYINQSEEIESGLLLNFYNGKLDYKRLEKDYTKNNNFSENLLDGGILGNSQDNSQLFFNVYTTRVDTVFGMSFVVMAPEHILVDQITTPEYAEAVKQYQEQAKHKTQLERTELQKEKTGQFTGAYAINPFNNEEIPVYIGDYVLANYGTGVVMAVPAHDERDFEFAKKYDIKITQSISPENTSPLTPLLEGEGNIEEEMNDIEKRQYKQVPEYIKELAKDLRKKQTKIEEMFWEIVRNRKLEGLKFRRQHPFGRYIADFYCDELKLIIELDGEIHKEQKEYDKNRDELLRAYDVQILRVENKEIKENIETVIAKILSFRQQIQNNSSPLLQGEAGGGVDIKCYPEKGILVNSGEFTGLESDEAITKMQERLAENKLGGKKTNYKIQDWVFSRQRYWGEPFPVLFDENKKVIPMSEKDLPLELPKVENYEPTGTEEGPLADIKEWIEVEDPETGKKYLRESNTMPGWAGSSRYWLRYMDPQNDEALVGKEADSYWKNVDVYVGGAEHVTRHMIYARFWQNFLHDLGVVSEKEPFKKYHKVGLIMGNDGRKMSKRRGNVINPDDVIAEHGTDALRVYEMFMGPFNQSIDWNTSGVKGVKKFLDKIIGLKDKIGDPSPRQSRGAPLQGEPQKSLSLEERCPKGGEVLYKDSDETLHILHTTIKKVTEDIDDFGFNTAISQMMILVNHLSNQETLTKHTYETLLQLIAPFAPHLAEELWEQIGNGFSIFTTAQRPKVEEKHLTQSSVKIAVQFNGKVRGTLQVDADISQDNFIEAVKADNHLAKYFPETPKKIIFIPGKICNIVG